MMASLPHDRRRDIHPAFVTGFDLMEERPGYVIWWSRLTGWSLWSLTGETVEEYGRSIPPPAVIDSQIRAYEATNKLIGLRHG
jgi:hypothetical protein